LNFSDLCRVTKYNFLTKTADACQQ
jgi:hypothetical protein